MSGIDLYQWCEQRAAAFREYEHVEMAAAPTSTDRDYALVEWVVKVLGNPTLPESRKVLRILAERHGQCDDPCGLRYSRPADEETVTPPAGVECTPLGGRRQALTEEPGPEVTEVYDGEGDAWVRTEDGRWSCVYGVTEPRCPAIVFVGDTWEDLNKHFGPVAIGGVS